MFRRDANLEAMPSSVAIYLYIQPFLVLVSEYSGIFCDPLFHEKFFLKVCFSLKEKKKIIMPFFFSVKVQL